MVRLRSNALGQIEGLSGQAEVRRSLSPLRRGTTGVSGILNTPCRKERGVPFAKRDKACRQNAHSVLGSKTLRGAT